MIDQETPKPWELDPRTVCYYSHTKQAFVDEYGEKTALAMHRKAVKFLERGLVSYAGSNTYEGAPIQGYNTRTYKLTKIPGATGGVADTFSCNCQGYNTKIRKGEKPGCSHTLALSYHFKMR